MLRRHLLLTAALLPATADNQGRVGTRIFKFTVA
jgi:hypothetical protein